MDSTKAKEVTRVTMDMLLRLRADGFHIGHIHSDQGHEFPGEFKVWCRERGITSQEPLVMTLDRTAVLNVL